MMGHTLEELEEGNLITFPSMDSVDKKKQEAKEEKGKRGHWKLKFYEQQS